MVRESHKKVKSQYLNMAGAQNNLIFWRFFGETSLFGSARGAWYFGRGRIGFVFGGKDLPPKKWTARPPIDLDTVLEYLKHN
jgi:hypothetical protein